MAKRRPYSLERDLCWVVVLGLAATLALCLFGCHPQFHHHDAQQGPEYHFFGTINKCPQEQADELERDPRWDAWENDDAPTERK